MVFAVIVSGCSTQISPQELLGMVPLNRQPEAPPPPVPSNEKPDADANRARIRAEQVEPIPSKTEGAPAGARVRQIPSSPDAGAALKTAIDADDPCLGEMQDTEQCRTTLEPASTYSSTSDRELTLTIVNPGTGSPGTFDAARAVNEIGRGRTVSQGAQSAGSAFLSGANPPPAEPETPDPALPDLPPGAVVVQPQ